MIRPFGYDQQF